MSKNPVNADQLSGQPTTSQHAVSTEDVSANDDAVCLEARPSEVLLLPRREREGSVTLIPPPPEYRATTSTTCTSQSNSRTYKPLPPVPEDVKRLHEGAAAALQPPPYAQLAVQYKQAAQRSLRNARRPRLLTPRTPGDGQIQQWLSLEDGQSGAQPLDEGRGSRAVVISVSQTLFCSLFACFCIPIIGWIPLAFACVSVQDNAPTNPSTQRVRKFVIMASCVCITIGLAMSTGLLIRCVRSGNCDEFANHWKKHWRFHTNTTGSLHAQ